MKTRALLKRLTASDIETRLRRRAVQEYETDEAASEIVDRVLREGEEAVRCFALRFGERGANEPLILDRSAMRAGLDAISRADAALLERAADRIRVFAEAQRASLRPMEAPTPGGAVGHTIEPMKRAGCYAPGGRHPLPSSALMTAVTARVAGCADVIVASPNSSPMMLAAASIAGADAFLTVGGAHAIAALARGLPDMPPRDIIVGPGNKWVTAAKKRIAGRCAIDMLAGPSELLILADETSDPEIVAADLLAQAEHDVAAAPMLITTSAPLVADVEAALERQLESLPTAPTARDALRQGGFVCIASSIEEAVALSDIIAPEHLEIITRDPERVARRIENAGALFIGARAAEVAGDYGVGPNHTLPTGGGARFGAGLSVFHFLRIRTWLRMDDRADDASGEIFADAARLARLEGLEAHARAAELRR